MDSYDPKSCSALEKPYYKPIEAALRWCGLIGHEAMILQITGENLFPKPSDFPHWRCLRANAEKIYEATVNGDLPYGRDGRTVPPSEPVAQSRLTIRHTDLKAWMAKHYPDQKPDFLFDAIEQKAHTAINADSFRVLQADRDAANAELEDAKLWAAKAVSEMDALRSERDALLEKLESVDQPTARSEGTYLKIIGALVDVVLGASPGGNKHSVFDSQASLIDAILAHYSGTPGISKTTLENKFSEARKSLKSA
jgi:hypothetical protein